MPYLSNKLGVNAIGTNAYVLSITTYFVTLAYFGVVIYGSREIAIVRDNIKELDKTFNEIYSQQFIAFVSISVFYVGFVLMWGGDFKPFFFAYLLYLLSGLLDISWFYVGIENFRVVAIRSILVRLVGFGLVLNFIKAPNDLLLYIILIQGCAAASNLFYWVNIRQHGIKRFTLGVSNVRKHFFGSLSLFLPQIAITIYAVADRTLLGMLSSVDQVGIFDYSENVVKILMLAFVSLSTVLVPRIANLYANNDAIAVKRYTDKMLALTTFFSVAFAWGICCVSKEIVYLLMGGQFAQGDKVISCLSPIVVIAGCSVWNILIAINRFKIYIYATFLGVVVNIVLNIILIPQYGALGSAVATICTELAVHIIGFFVASDIFSAKLFVINVTICNLIGLAMYFVTDLFQIENLSVSLLLKIAVGGVVYMSLSFLLNRKQLLDVCDLVLSSFFSKSKKAYD